MDRTKIFDSTYSFELIDSYLSIYPQGFEVDISGTRLPSHIYSMRQSRDVGNCANAVCSVLLANRGLRRTARLQDWDRARSSSNCTGPALSTHDAPLYAQLLDAFFQVILGVQLPRIHANRSSLL